MAGKLLLKQREQNLWCGNDQNRKCNVKAAKPRSIEAAVIGATRSELAPFPAGPLTAGVTSGARVPVAVPGAPAAVAGVESGPGAARGDSSGDATGWPRRAGQLFTSAPATLHTVGRARAFVTFSPGAADGSALTSCRSWHKQTGLLTCTLVRAEQHVAGGVAALEET